MPKDLRTPNGLVIPRGNGHASPDVEIRGELIDVRCVTTLEAPTERAAIEAANAFLAKPGGQGTLARSFDELVRCETDPDVVLWRLVWTETRLYAVPVPPGS